MVLILWQSVAKLPDNRTYVTRGNIYVRYSDRCHCSVDSGYPTLIKGNWGDLPDKFLAGFDSMMALTDGKIYVTKGDQYVRYSNISTLTVDPGFPAQLQGNLPAEFATGFDSASAFPDGTAYVTKGSKCILYSNIQTRTISPGYPAPIQHEWGILPANFADGFDSMAVLSDGNFFVTKKKQYMHLQSSSDTYCSAIDTGYPLPIRGNWGRINFPMPQ